MNANYKQVCLIYSCININKSEWKFKFFIAFKSFFLENAEGLIS